MGSHPGGSVAYSEMSEKQAVKTTRKKIENDIQLLKNRVRMLQKEKEKADKKIVSEIVQIVIFWQFYVQISWYFEELGVTLFIGRDKS